MENQTLLDLHPTVASFRRAVGATVKKGVYHQHPDGRANDCFAYILNGAATYEFGDYAFKARAGDLLFLARGSSYTMTVHDEYGFLLVNFNFNTPKDSLLSCDAFPAPSGKKTEDLFHKIVSTWQRAHPTAKEDCLALLYMIYSDFLNTANASYIHSAKRERMESAIAFIQNNLADGSLTISKIADYVHMGERHFRRSFKDTYNMSPLRYINMKRITRAKELLRYGNLPLGQIAELTGFSSIYYFSNTFKKEVHCSPSEYRKTKQKNPVT